MGKVLGGRRRRRRIREGRMRREEKNLLTADFSASDDGERGGEDTALYFFKHGTEKASCAAGRVRAERKKGAERQEEQEVDGKVIAVSTWSIA